MGKAFGLGFQFAAAILLFVYAGVWADRRLGWTPWGVLIGAFVGFVVGLYSLYRTAMRSDREEGPPTRPSGGSSDGPSSAPANGNGAQ